MRKLLMAILGGVVAAAVTASTAIADQTYTDATGDAGRGSDIANIAVANDQSGTITFRITTVSPIAGNHALVIFIDADKNPATGGWAATGPPGLEYSMLATPDEGGLFLKWYGFWLEIPSSLRTSAIGNVMEFVIDRSDLGNTAGFGFAVSSVGVDRIPGQAPVFNIWDGAPDSGSYTYDLVYPQCSNGKDDDGDSKVDADDLGCSSTTDDLESDDPVTLRAGKAKIVPAKPIAGKTVVVSARVTRVETNAPVTSGSVGCEMTAAGKTYRKRGSFAGNGAICRFPVPKQAAKKLVRGKITVTHLGKTVTVPFSFGTA